MNEKINISGKINETEQLPPILAELKKEAGGFKVPEGYFDSLNVRIVDSINKKVNRSFLMILIAAFRKPLVWVPSMATVTVAVLLIFVVPLKKPSTIQVADEWVQIHMAYDESYAQEALLAESSTIDKELENSVNNNIGTEALNRKEPSLEEIKEYLKEHENEMDLINEYKKENYEIKFCRNCFYRFASGIYTYIETI